MATKYFSYLWMDSIPIIKKTWREKKLTIIYSFYSSV